MSQAELYDLLNKIIPPLQITAYISVIFAAILASVKSWYGIIFERLRDRRLRGLIKKLETKQKQIQKEKEQNGTYTPRPE